MNLGTLIHPVSVSHPDGFDSWLTLTTLFSGAGQGGANPNKAEGNLIYCVS